MSIGTNIYTLRKSMNVTQAELAEKLGVSVQAVSKWEHDTCAPDVSLFPALANFFGVSIDRLFGFHMNSYSDEVEQIIKAADDSNDTYKEIEIVSEGLKRYPNSPELKIYLAFSLSMVNRISEDENERKEAIKKAIKLCYEITDTCGDIKQVDRALNMLVRIYNEIGEYQKAEDCIEKISANRYDSRIMGKVKLLGGKGNFAEQSQYAETELWKMWLTADHVFEILTNRFYNNKEYRKALDFIEAHEKLLSVFDFGCLDFYATHKIWASNLKARVYMKMKDKKRCLNELSRFFELAAQVRTVAESKDFHISARNPVYFSNVRDEQAYEEYMTKIYPNKVFLKFDKFFGDDEKYLEFKKAMIG